MQDGTLAGVVLGVLAAVAAHAWYREALRWLARLGRGATLRSDRDMG